jgi:Mg2+/Co2+ transporter CorC
MEINNIRKSLRCIHSRFFIPVLSGSGDNVFGKYFILFLKLFCHKQHHHMNMKSTVRAIAFCMIIFVSIAGVAQPTQ